MNLLIQFLLRLSFGLAAGMAITSPRLVTSGYFRNHLYVTLGLTTLAAMVSYYLPDPGALVPRQLQSSSFLFCISAAIASYVGSVFWLYEKRGLGRLILVLVALCSLCGATAQRGVFRMNVVRDRGVIERYVELTSSRGAPSESEMELLKRSNQELDKVETQSGYLIKPAEISSGLLLGLTMAAMLLGHWYLNTPTMELAPLRRLIIAMGVAVVLQAIVSGLGLWGELTYANEISTQWVLFLILRWSFGIIGVGVLAWMAWQTLKIPNTQSATGLLYVAVIGTFVGETMGLLLSGESLFPL